MAAIGLDLEPLAWANSTDFGREADPPPLDLRWRVQSRPRFRGEGNSDGSVGWKVRGRGEQWDLDGEQGPLPLPEGAWELDEGAAVRVARRAARGLAGGRESARSARGAAREGREWSGCAWGGHPSGQRSLPG